MDFLLGFFVRLGIRRPAPRPSLVLAIFLLAATGCAGLDSVALLRPIGMGPFLDRPARLTVARLLSDVDSGTLAAVIVNFEGQNLRADSVNMNFDPTTAGTLDGILTGALERYKFDLFEVRGPGRKLLGYMLAQQYRLAGYYFDDGGTLILTGAVPKAFGDGDE